METSIFEYALAMLLDLIPPTVSEHDMQQMMDELENEEEI